MSVYLPWSKEFSFFSSSFNFTLKEGKKPPSSQMKSLFDRVKKIKMTFINQLDQLMCSSVLQIQCKDLFANFHLPPAIAHFPVVCSVTWPTNASEAGGDGRFKCQLFSIRTTWVHKRLLSLYSRIASLPFKSQVTVRAEITHDGLVDNEDTCDWPMLKSPEKPWTERK